MRRRETGEACERPVRCRPGPGPGVCGKRGEGRRYKIIWREAKREGGSLYNNYFNNSHSRILSSIGSYLPSLSAVNITTNCTTIDDKYQNCCHSVI